MSKELTHKEALDYLKNRISKLALNHKIGNRDIANSEIKEIAMGIKTHVTPIFEHALTELEELKRDVKRYFELQYKNQFGHMTQNEIHEMYVLRDKLMKVGNEE